MVREHGWNTWDYRSYNTFSFLENGRFDIDMRISVFDETKLLLYSDFRWKDLEAVGPHATDGSYTYHRFRADDSIFEVESASIGDSFFCRIDPVEGTNKRVVVEIIPAGRVGVTRKGKTLVADKWRIHFFRLHFKEKFFLRCENDYLVGGEGKGAAFAFTRRAAKINLSKLKSAINRVRDNYKNTTPKGGGYLKDCFEAVTRAIGWNTIFDPKEKGICTPVSRDWSIDWKGALIFCWDTFLIGLLSSIEDKDLPWHNFDAVFRGATKQGFVPNYAISPGVSSLDRSQPPVGAYCVWKTHHIAPDKNQLKRLYPRLLKWHRWWFKDRDGNGDGLLEWGSNPSPRYEFPDIKKHNPHIQHAHICAAYESGQDNSPVFDDIPYNDKKNVLECSDIALNSLYAVDAEALSEIAAELGRKRNAAQLSKEYRLMKERINKTLWSEDDGIYLCRLWDGRFIKRLSPINFFPMIAGIPSSEQAKRMVREHLLNDDEFWGDYTAPTIARNDPAFDDNNYWRGRIWPPFNFLLYEGLRRYDFHDVANEFAMKSLDAFLKNWRVRNHVCENYNSVNGEGTDVPNSDPLYAWGALMGYIAIQELADINSREGLRFGNLSGREGRAERLRIGEHAYEVSISTGGLEVARDGKRLLSTDAPAIVRNILMKGKTLSCEVVSVRAKRISFYNLEPNSRKSITMNGKVVKVRTNSRGTATVIF